MPVSAEYDLPYVGNSIATVPMPLVSSGCDFLLRESDLDVNFEDLTSHEPESIRSAAGTTEKA